MNKNNDSTSATEDEIAGKSYIIGPAKKKQRYYVIGGPLINEIVHYLSQQPYNEVNNLISRMQVEIKKLE